MRLAATLDLRALSGGLSYDDVAKNCVAIASDDSFSPEGRAIQFLLFFKLMYTDDVQYDGAPVRAAMKSKMFSVSTQSLPSLLTRSDPESARLAQTHLVLLFRLISNAKDLGLYELATEIVSTDFILLMAEWSLKHPELVLICESLFIFPFTSRGSGSMSPLKKTNSTTIMPVI